MARLFALSHTEWMGDATMKARYIAAVGFAVLALAGCASGGTAAPTPTAAPTTKADMSWAPIGMVHVDGLAWQWTPKGEFRCDSFQAGCFGVTVATRDGCPDGVFIELAVLDSSGAVVDKANEITAGLGPGDIAKAVLSPPAGTPTGAEAKVSRLSCL